MMDKMTTLRETIREESIGQTHKMVGDLYRLDFADGKSYIGACICGAEKRYHDHERLVRKGEGHLIHKAWRKLGAPKLIVLQKRIPENKLWAAEKKAIAKHNTVFPDGYNGHPGTEKRHGMLGKTYVPSEEHRKKLSVALTGYKKTSEHRNNISKAQKGKPSTFKGHKHTEEAKEKNRQAHLGKKHTEEHKEKNRASHLGLKRTKETKARMSIAQLKRRQKERDATYSS